MERKSLKMKSLKAKLKKQGGFTLIEMLIVVAIIAILIAVSIPMVTGTLEKSRHAVDDANHRDAVALGVIEYLSDPSAYTAATTTKFYKVTNSQGELVDAATGDKHPDDALTASCSCTSGSTSGSTSTNKYLKVTITNEGDVAATWVAD